MKEHRLHLLVCAGTGCVACRSFEIREELEKEIVKQGLQDEVKVVTTGCQGFCERGPIVIAQPDGIFYQRMTLEDIPHLVTEHLFKGSPVEKLMYKPSRKEPPVPRMTMSVASEASRAPAVRMAWMSSCRSGNRSSGSPPSACRARIQSSAAALCASAFSNAASVTPWVPIFSARALSID